MYKKEIMKILSVNMQDIKKGINLTFKEENYNVWVVKYHRWHKQQIRYFQ